MAWNHLGERGGAEYMDSFYDILSRLDEDGADDLLQTHRLTNAMTNLVGLIVRLHQERDNEWAISRMPEFRARARRLLIRYLPILSGYIAGLETAVWEGDPEGWLEVSLKRSAIQAIIDEIDHNDGDQLIVERHRIHDVDLEMMEAAHTMPSLPPQVIPQLPPNHWWWHVPDVPRHAVRS